MWLIKMFASLLSRQNFEPSMTILMKVFVIFMQYKNDDDYVVRNHVSTYFHLVNWQCLIEMLLQSMPLYVVEMSKGVGLL